MVKENVIKYICDKRKNCFEMTKMKYTERINNQDEILDTFILKIIYIFGLFIL